MNVLRGGRGFLNEKMHNTMIQHSVFAGIVFLIVAHPETFKLVDRVIKVHDKNILLLVHAVVVAIIMYFGSMYLFEPLQHVLLEGVVGKPKSAQRIGRRKVEDTRLIPVPVTATIPSPLLGSRPSESLQVKPPVQHLSVQAVVKNEPPPPPPPTISLQSRAERLLDPPHTSGGFTRWTGVRDINSRLHTLVGPIPPPRSK